MNRASLVARYRAYIADLNASRFDDAAQFYAEQVWFDDQPFARQAFRDQVLTLGHQIAPDTHIAIEGLVVSGDNLAARLVRTGTPLRALMGIPPAGVPTRLREHAFYHLTNGVCDRVWSVLDLASLLASPVQGGPDR
jgi:predicted ester cyclase